MTTSIKLADFVGLCYKNNNDLLRIVLGEKISDYYVNDKSVPSWRNFISIAKISGYSILNLESIMKEVGGKPDTKVSSIKSTIRVKNGDNTFIIVNNKAPVELIEEILAIGPRKKEEIKLYLKEKAKISVSDQKLMNFLNGYKAYVENGAIYFSKKTSEDNWTHTCRHVHLKEFIRDIIHINKIEGCPFPFLKIDNWVDENAIKWDSINIRDFIVICAVQGFRFINLNSFFDCLGSKNPNEKVNSLFSEPIQIMSQNFKEVYYISTDCTATIKEYIKTESRLGIKMDDIKRHVSISYGVSLSEKEIEAYIQNVESQ